MQIFNKLLQYIDTKICYAEWFHVIGSQSPDLADFLLLVFPLLSQCHSRTTAIWRPRILQGLVVRYFGVVCPCLLDTVRCWAYQWFCRISFRFSFLLLKECWIYFWILAELECPCSQMGSKVRIAVDSGKWTKIAWAIAIISVVR